MADHLFDWHGQAPATCRQGAVTVGNFDGVHRGHAALVSQLCAQARTVNGPAVVVTFHPHPMELLRPGSLPPPLTTPAERSRLLHQLGVHEVVVLKTTDDLLALSAAAFFDEVIQKRLAVRALIEGKNFGFGHNREGNIETLARLCQAAHLQLAVVEPFLFEDAEVSSTRIRSELMKGAVDRANMLLGRPYRISGTVETGQRRGRTIGFPTANLEEVPTLVPADGVYAVRVLLPSGEIKPGAANVGPNPTFGENARKIEVHLIQFDGDLYGKTIDVEFLARLRETRPFANVAQLTEQLKVDIAAARRVVDHLPPHQP